jgi:hypothetical protein
MVDVIARLGDDPEIGECFEELTGKSRPLAVGYKGVEAPERRGRAEWLGEYSNLGMLAQPPDTTGPFVRLMNVIKNRDTHSLPASYVSEWIVA